jgi:hypothetical protein
MQNHVVTDGDGTEPYSGLPLTTLKEIKARSADSVPSTHPEPDIDRN